MPPARGIVSTQACLPGCCAALPCPTRPRWAVPLARCRPERPAAPQAARTWPPPWRLPGPPPSGGSAQGCCPRDRGGTALVHVPAAALCQQPGTAGELQGEPLVGIVEVDAEQVSDAAQPVGHRVTVQ